MCCGGGVSRPQRPPPGSAPVACRELFMIPWFSGSLSNKNSRMLYSCHTRDSTRLKIRHQRLYSLLNDAVRVFSIQISLPYSVNGLCEPYVELSLATCLLRVREFNFFWQRTGTSRYHRPRFINPWSKSRCICIKLMVWATFAFATFWWVYEVVY